MVDFDDKNTFLNYKSENETPVDTDLSNFQEEVIFIFQEFQ